MAKLVPVFAPKLNDPAQVEAALASAAILPSAVTMPQGRSVALP